MESWAILFHSPVMGFRFGEAEKQEPRRSGRGGLGTGATVLTRHRPS